MTILIHGVIELALNFIKEKLGSMIRSFAFLQLFIVGQKHFWVCFPTGRWDDNTSHKITVKSK